MGYDRYFFREKWEDRNEESILLGELGNFL